MQRSQTSKHAVVSAFSLNVVTLYISFWRYQSIIWLWLICKNHLNSFKRQIWVATFLHVQISSATWSLSPKFESELQRGLLLASFWVAYSHRWLLPCGDTNFSRACANSSGWILHTGKQTPWSRKSDLRDRRIYHQSYIRKRKLLKSWQNIIYLSTSTWAGFSRVYRISSIILLSLDDMYDFRSRSACSRKLLLLNNRLFTMLSGIQEGCW